LMANKSTRLKMTTKIPLLASRVSPFAKGD